MTFRATTIAAAAALAVILGGTATEARPARKPVAAARAKAVKPVPKPPVAAEPGAAASDAAAEASAPAEPDAAPESTSESGQPSRFDDTFSDLLKEPAELKEPDEAEAPATETVAGEPAPSPAEAAAAPEDQAGRAEAASETAEATPADVPAAPRKGDPPTHAFMVGVWAEAGKNCETALDFKADGKLIGPFSGWQLSEDGVLTMTGSRQKIWLKVIDQGTMQSRRSETDPPRILKRC